jgi:catechol 2,3-dioxygenase-like lactoylglutathione lyase family enzyme
VTNRLDVFRSLHHVCLVVADLDAATAYYESVGIGPWHDYPPLDAYLHDLRGPDPQAFLELRYRYADLDNVQLQLCQPGPGGTPQRRFLDTKGPGVYHLGFDVPDCDRAEQDAVAAGLHVTSHGRRVDGSGFTYFDTAPAAGVVLEVRAALGSRDA